MNSRRAAIAALGSGAVATCLAGTAYAFWTSFGSGSGTALSGTAQNVTISTGTPVSKLYPGGSADVAAVVTNPNPYAVNVTGLAAGAISSGNTTCDTSGSGVTFNSPSSAIRVPANATNYSIDIPGGASMAISSDNSCQNRTFTIPLTGTATATS